MLQALKKAETQHGMSLYEISQDLPVLAIFLRSFCCPFCRKALHDVSRLRRDIELEGVCIVLVHMGDPDMALKMFKRYNLNDISYILDTQKTLYQAVNLYRVSPLRLLRIKDLYRIFRTVFVEHHGISPSLDADWYQMPGIFLVHRGKIIHSFRYKSIADRPDYVNLARYPLHRSL